MAVFRRKQSKGFNEELYARLGELISDAEEAGISQPEIDEKIRQVLTGAIDQSVPSLVRTLEKRAPRMLREHRKMNRRFIRRLRRRWQDPLDRYYAVLVSAIEMGGDFSKRNEEEARESGDLVYEAVVGLHAQACRVAWEVYSLLQTGFPYGALARCRTLHELAVISMVLTDHGRNPDHGELAERFFEHGSVMQYKEVKEYQDACDALGYEPFPDEEVEGYKAEYERLLLEYGPKFKQEYGWAVGLVANPTFRELEKLAELSHLRGHYKWSSKEIHVGPRGWTQNVVEFRGRFTHLAGPTNSFLADPGQMAVISLYQATVALLVAGAEDAPTPLDLLALQTMGVLVDKCCDALVDTQEQLDADEEKIEKKHRLK